MTVRHPAVRIEVDSEGTARTIAARSLYLDTSDLSYLILGRVGPRDHRPVEWRRRLVEHLAADRVRLRLSMVHLAELALRPELAREAAALLESIPGVYLATTGPDEIFRQELERVSPLVIVERRLRPEDLAELRVPLQLPISSISGTTAAHAIKSLIQLGRRAEDFRKRAARRDAASPEAKRQQEKVVRQILRGDASSLPWWLWPLGALFTTGLKRGLAWKGLPGDYLERAYRENKRGLLWAHGRNGQLPRHDGKRWNAEDVAAMPASVLRGAVERAYHGDLNRPSDAGTAYDVLHIAYAAYSDLATIDAANFSAVGPTRSFLPHLSIIPTGDVGAVLDSIDTIHP